MGRKVFLSFLGGSDYKPCVYYFPNGGKSPELRYIQEATLLNLTEQENWTSSDVAYILLTDYAKERNWEDNVHLDRDTGEKIKSEGLASKLNKAGLPMRIHPVFGLRECINIDDIMLLFSNIFDLLEEGDSLYLDLTHGYRYFPMLVLVLSAYARFLKNIEVKSVTYGNFEAVKGPEKPVIDLISLVSLLDWTFAAGQYVKSGNIDELVRLSREELSVLKNSRCDKTTANLLQSFINQLNIFINERRLCQGKSIIESTTFSMLQKTDEKLKRKESVLIPALDPILNKIRSTFDDIDTKENIRNGYMAAKWCFDNGLYQQAITILQESIITEICMEAGLDWQSKTYRGFVGAAMTKLKGAEMQCINLPDVADKESAFKNVLESQSLKRHITDLENISRYRNAFNHAGMNKDCRFQLKAVKNAFDKVLKNCLLTDVD